MKRLFTLAVLGLFCCGLYLGCHADAGVGDDTTTTSSGTSYSKKTTTVQEPSGDRTTRTEVRTSNP